MEKLTDEQYQTIKDFMDNLRPKSRPVHLHHAVAGNNSVTFPGNSPGASNQWVPQYPPINTAELELPAIKQEIEEIQQAIAELRETIELVMDAFNYIRAVRS